nr:MAG TPA: hypothetical protein [Caudoviricetes sp.]
MPCQPALPPELPRWCRGVPRPQTRGRPSSRKQSRPRRPAHSCGSENGIFG